MRQGESYLRTYPRKPRSALLQAGACSCEASPFCQGPASVDWLGCDAACRACHPPEPRGAKDVDVGGGGG
jgi:hypothetical protein